MEIAQHITIVGQEGKLLADSARTAGLDVTIPTCPGWAMRDLVRHLGEIHLWAAAHVSRRATKPWVDDTSELTGYWPELGVFWPDDEDLIDWYLKTNANLVNELESAPADLDTMTFLPAPSPLAMWARRQAHETSVHRFDAQNAAGAVTGYDAVFASDGVDELLMAFAPRASTFAVAERRTMSVHASDTDDRWFVSMTPDGIESVRGSGEGEADVSLVGAAEDLYLSLWNRGDRQAVAVEGDRQALVSWHEGHRVRWS